MIILFDAENKEDRELAKKFLGCYGVQMDEEDYNPNISELIENYSDNGLSRLNEVFTEKWNNGQEGIHTFNTNKLAGRYFAFKLEDVNISDSIKDKIVKE